MIKRPYVDERTIPVVSAEEMRGLLALVDPFPARIPGHRSRLLRSRAVLFLLRDIPGRRSGIAMLSAEGVNLASKAAKESHGANCGIPYVE